MKFHLKEAWFNSVHVMLALSTLGGARLKEMAQAHVNT